MNPSHYPSLGNCKLLTESEFHITEKFYQYWKICDAFKDCMIHSEALVCPSIAELLDELPHKLPWYFELTIEKYYTKYKVIYKNWRWLKEWSFRIWELPNALSETWLWLKENDLLPK